MSNTSKFFGCSPPLTNASPSNEENFLDKDLEAYLRNREDVLDSDIGVRKRRAILNRITVDVRSWAKAVGESKNLSEDICINGGGIQLRFFGSTRLKVNTPDSDIDIICIAPSFLSRSDFFTLFCSYLSKLEYITSLSVFADAHTPVVKCCIDGLSIDMIFVSIQQQTLPVVIDVMDDKYLLGLDDQAIRSFNGCRLAEYICNLVPNVETFCTALRTVKHWAKQRGLYSNILGFLGGVNYAILVAFVCQKFVNACAATLVKNFFLIYANWNWPCPVLLKDPEKPTGPANSGGSHFRVWNPRVNVSRAYEFIPSIGLGLE